MGILIQIRLFSGSNPGSYRVRTRSISLSIQVGSIALATESRRPGLIT